MSSTFMATSVVMNGAPLLSHVHNNSPSPTNGPAPPAISPVIPIPGQTDFPNNTYAGDYKFTVAFTKANEVESKKTISYVFFDYEQVKNPGIICKDVHGCLGYSESLNKLYVCIKKTCPVHFKVNGKPPRGALVRAIAIYSRPQDVSEPVRRCMNHAAEDRDDPLRDHFVRCQNPNANHVEDQGRHSVLFRWEDPQAGCDFNIGLYQFTCFSSCTGTINRRPTQLVFTLEYEGNVLGRQVVDLRICACPGRDKVSDEGIKDRKHRSSQENGHSVHYFGNTCSTEPHSKRFKNEDEIFTIQVRGRETYELVKSVVEKLEQARKYTELMSEAGFVSSSSVDHHHHLRQSDLPSPSAMRTNGYTSVLKMSPDLCDTYEVSDVNGQLLNLSPRQVATLAGTGACLPISSVGHLNTPSSSALVTVVPRVISPQQCRSSSESSSLGSLEVDVRQSAIVPTGLLSTLERVPERPEPNKVADWIQATTADQRQPLQEQEDVDVNPNIFLQGYVQRLLNSGVSMPGTELYNRLLYAAAGSLPPILPGSLGVDALSALSAASPRFSVSSAGLLSPATLPLQLKTGFADIVRR